MDRIFELGNQMNIAPDTGDAIRSFVGANEMLGVTLTRSTGERLEATVPAFALKVLAEVLAEIAQGRTVALVPHRAELTTYQAAQMLHVSRPFLIKMLDSGVIEHRKVGRHRRVRYDDVQAYLEKEKAARRQTLATLAAYDQEIGLYDLDSE